MGYMLGTAEALLMTRSAPSFYRTVDSERIVYGQLDGEVFEHEFEDRQAWEEFATTLAQELASDRS